MSGERRRLKQSPKQARKPFVYETRSYGPLKVLRVLADEYEHGTSLTKLYVSLLAKALADQDPKVRTKFPYELERCGVRQTEDA
jgi:hypothetical protein